MRRIVRHQGYGDFADGTFGSGGQNLYVSAAGVLQRIHRFDFNKDGWMDVLFVNSQDMDERPPLTVVNDPLGAAVVTTLPSLGAYCAASGDLNGDGWTDLVVGHQCNGTHSDLVAHLFYGSPDGLSPRHCRELPAPDCRAVAVGDFNGDGRPDLAFACAGQLWVYFQALDGFDPAARLELPLRATHLVAGDLDGDGYADLVARVPGVGLRILWGGPGGLDLDRFLDLSGLETAEDESFTPGSSEGWVRFEEGWSPAVIPLDGQPHLFLPARHEAWFYPITGDRRIGSPVSLPVERAVAATLGDLDGDGVPDLVVASRLGSDEEVAGRVFWSASVDFSEFRCRGARGVVCADLDGDSCSELVVVQGRNSEWNTTSSRIFRAVDRELRLVSEPKTHDAVAAVPIPRAAGNPDLVWIHHVGGSAQGRISAYGYLGGPDGFHPDRRIELPGWSAPAALCADVNDDGWPDVLIANCSEDAPHLDPGSFLYLGGPTGFSEAHRVVLPTVRAHGCAVGDFRRCGYLDVAVVGYSNPVLTLFQGGTGGLNREQPMTLSLDPSRPDLRDPGDGGFDLSGSGAEYREPRWLLSGDFNRDGWLDLVVPQCAGSRSLILWGGPDGFSLQRCQWLLAEGVICAQAADLTGNGYLDLILGGHQSLGRRHRYESSIYIYWGGPDGFQESRRQQLPAHTCNSLAVADFNRDGALDLFATSYNSGRERDLDAFLYWGGPGGEFRADRVSRLFTHSSCGCHAADLNGDGWVDLAVANHKTRGNHQGKSQIWWNGPQGFSDQRVTWLPTLGPHGMLAVDPGNQYDRGPEEFYESAPIELTFPLASVSLCWEAELEPETWVRGQLRTATQREQLAHEPWIGAASPGTEGSVVDSPVPAGARWVQYRLALGSRSGNSPRVTAVELFAR